MSAATTQLNTQSLAEMIRSWVHFDNLSATFTRQAQQARTARARWETQIIEYLRQTNMANAIIQIAGGKLSIAEEKHTNPLTITRIEELLHEYYERSGRKAADETTDIIKFLKSERGSNVSKKLKKQTA